MQISKKPKNVSQTFLLFLEIYLIYFEQKDEPHNLSICKIIDCKIRGYLNVKRVLFHITFLAANVLMGYRHCRHLHGSILILLILYSKMNCLGKLWNLKDMKVLWILLFKGQSYYLCDSCDYTCFVYVT